MKSPLSFPRWRAAHVAAVSSVFLLTACEPDIPFRSVDPSVRERLVRTESGTWLQTRIDRLGSAQPQPTVVLISGLDSPLEVWSEVRRRIATDVPVFSYDRAGIGRSGAVSAAASGARPASVVARELHEALRAARVRGPYVLVAHSIGGLYARVFANRYPSEVAGIVLVDATHETLLSMLEPEDVVAIAEQQRWPGAKLEVLSQARSVMEVLASPLPDVPLSVITSMKAEEGQGPEAREWFAQLQGEWLRQVSRGEQVRTPVGHMIPLEAPDVVVSATRRVLGWARGAR